MLDQPPPEKDMSDPAGPHFTAPEAEPSPGNFSAWEEVSAGRFMPRRIRGSCQGRALG